MLQSEIQHHFHGEEGEKNEREREENLLSGEPFEIPAVSNGDVHGSRLVSYRQALPVDYVVRDIGYPVLRETQNPRSIRRREKKVMAEGREGDWLDD